MFCNRPLLEKYQKYSQKVSKIVKMEIAHDPECQLKCADVEIKLSRLARSWRFPDSQCRLRALHLQPCWKCVKGGG